jgi:hypothetical protein
MSISRHGSLVGGATWPGFHARLINETVAVMQPQLRERGYYIDSGERVWMVEPRRPIYPDNVVFMLQHRTPVSVAQAEYEIRESYLEIFDAEGH